MQILVARDQYGGNPHVTVTSRQCRGPAARNQKELKDVGNMRSACIVIPAARILCALLRCIAAHVTIRVFRRTGRASLPHDLPRYLCTRSILMP